MEQSNKDKEYQTVILSALLHDIGKILMRGDFSAGLKIEGQRLREKGTNPRKGIETWISQVS